MIPTDEQIHIVRDAANAAIHTNPVRLAFTALIHRSIIEEWEKVRPVPPA